LGGGFGWTGLSYKYHASIFKAVSRPYQDIKRFLGTEGTTLVKDGFTSELIIDAEI
jgi:hypothetical protein